MDQLSVSSAVMAIAKDRRAPALLLLVVSFLYVLAAATEAAGVESAAACARAAFSFVSTVAHRYKSALAAY